MIFRICEEMRFTVPNTMKSSLYLKPFLFIYRNILHIEKEKFYVGGKKFEDLVELIEKHNTENFASLQLKTPIKEQLNF